ncbi:MAG: hypothetical protein LBS52_03010 [Dysgonamonadaceae bacterium]|jgi:DNA-directed RNA polymerase subunit RPC12/RpoP|nr:hypothetical protein [Dysgonamonadaceae bacterium]
MNSEDFIREFPGEAGCKAKFKAFREQAGVACLECGSRQGLKTNAAMRKSKLPSRYRFLAVHLLTPAKKSFSAAGLQRQPGHERYRPVWHLAHKLRTATGLRGGEYVLAGGTELGGGYFSTGIQSVH